jgi:hypothetical protein
VFLKRLGVSETSRRFCNAKDNKQLFMRSQASLIFLVFDHKIYSNKINWETTAMVYKKVEEETHLHPKATCASTERVRKFRRRNQAKKDFSNIIQLMTGENTGSGTYSKYPSTLLCVDVYSQKKWASRVGSPTFGKEGLNEVKQLRQPTIDYAGTSRGYVGVAPPILIANILRELKGGCITDMEKEIEWKNIQLRVGLGERSGGRGQYYMFHWGNKKCATENNVLDWKREDNLFSRFVQEGIDNFAFKITQRFLSSGTGVTIESMEQFLECYSVLPGMAKTKTAYNQAAHTDFDPWGLIIHMPLSKEGMMLRIWNASRASGSRVGKGEYHYIPFGCFFVLPSYVTHSGVYGRSGNFRFHMIVRKKTDSWERDEIKTGVDKDTPEMRPNWRGVFTERKKEASRFSNLYMEYLEENLGATFRREWLE